MFTGTMASSIAQPLASPLSPKRSPTTLAITSFYHQSQSSPQYIQVFFSLDGSSSPRHPIVIRPCLKRVIVSSSVPNVAATGARWYPNCVSSHNRIPCGPNRKSHQASAPITIFDLLPAPAHQCPLHLPLRTRSPTLLPSRVEIG